MNTAGKAGSTLVEVMISCFILAIIAIAGAAYLAHGNTTIVVQKNRRTALEAANSRLEEIRGWPYGRQTNSLGTSSTNVNINGILLPMTSRVQFFDVGPGLTNAAVQVTVSVAYRADLTDTNNLIILQTLVAP